MSTSEVRFLDGATWEWGPPLISGIVVSVLITRAAGTCYTSRSGTCADVRGFTCSTRGGSGGWWANEGETQQSKKEEDPGQYKEKCS
jgi:hypothetical protein